MNASAILFFSQFEYGLKHECEYLYTIMNALLYLFTLINLSYTLGESIFTSRKVENKSITRLYWFPFVEEPRESWSQHFTPTYMLTSFLFHETNIIKLCDFFIFINFIREWELNLLNLKLSSLLEIILFMQFTCYQ